MTPPRQPEPPPRAPARPHPNRLPFQGYLTVVEQPSDLAVGRARGLHVILTRDAVEEALGTLVGMCVDFKDGWEGHNARQKCGVIMEAELRGDRLWVCGHLFDRDFPEVAQAIRTKDMGMSYDATEVHIVDLRAPVWTTDRLTFCGASILLRLKAAYHASKIWIVE